jgi:glycosyltransferase involved in cell wall biosynthesis
LYRSSMPSGENRVVAAEVAALRDAGVEVQTFLPSSDDIGTMSMVEKVQAGMSPITGSSSKAKLSNLLQDFEPNVVHLHNPYPLVSPRLLEMCADARIPTVATIHNFRLKCLNGLFYRDGRICTDCEDRRAPVPGVLHACYRDSVPQSGLMATAIAVHRKRWDHVSRFIAVSEFVADRLRSWGIAGDRISVKPNLTQDPGPISPPGRGFLFAGRLAKEKGTLLLLDAWERSGLDGVEDLLIAGDGPLLENLQSTARKMRSVRLLGVLGDAEIEEARRTSAVAVIPSLCFETHSSAPESFSHGRPVIATRAGALASVVDDSVGWSIEPTVEGLTTALIEARAPKVVQARGLAARARYESNYRPDVVVAKLLEIYESAMCQ